MKKFSKITNQKVSEEPKIKETPLTEGDLFKSSVLNLMDQLLTIRTYGPVDRYLREGSIKIDGKEMFLEALIDLMSNKSLKGEVKLLEGLKSKISDWKSLDKEIEDINTKIDESVRGKMLNHRMKIINLFKLYKDDKDTLMSQIDEMAGKIKNGDKAFWRGVTAENMASEGKFPKNVMKEIANKFYFRARQLGYNK
jgi:hypothetical protein